MPSASKSSVDRPGNAPPVWLVTGDSDEPAGISSQSGRPTTGRRGLPCSAGSVRHDETPGYGCETGPPNQRSSIATGKSLIHGMKRSWYEVPPYGVGRSSGLGCWRSIASMSPMTAVASWRAPHSIWPYCAWSKSSRWWTGCPLSRSTSLVPVALYPGGRGRVWGEDRHAPRRAVDHPRHRVRELAGDQVVALEHLRVLADVDERRQRLGVAPVVDVLEVDDRQVVVGVGTREAGGRAVVGLLRAHRVALEGVEAADRRADARPVQVVEGLLHRRRVLARVVVEEAEVEDVLERPHAPVQRRVRRRRVVVGHRHRQIRLADRAVGLVGEQLRGAPPQRVLRDVVVVGDHRDVLAVGALDHERAHGLARLHAVGGLVLDLLKVRVGVAVAAVAGRGVLAGGVADVVGAVEDGGARADLSGVRDGGQGEGEAASEQRGEPKLHACPNAAVRKNWRYGGASAAWRKCQVARMTAARPLVSAMTTSARVGVAPNPEKTIPRPRTVALVAARNRASVPTAPAIAKRARGTRMATTRHATAMRISLALST